MRKRLGCLHAHYTNIEYIETAFSSNNIELIHFVDPGLMARVLADETFHKQDAQHKVKEQIEWIALCNVDAILITCTNYIALLREELLSIPVPIIKIDEPYFDSICRIEKPQKLLFTNPATVEGTMERLRNYAQANEKSPDIEAVVIENTFELIMQGRRQDYNQELYTYLLRTMESEERIVSVAQLSMVQAARQVAENVSTPILNPLDPLVASIVNELDLKRV